MLLYNMGLFSELVLIKKGTNKMVSMETAFSASYFALPTLFQITRIRINSSIISGFENVTLEISIPEHPNKGSVIIYVLWDTMHIAGGRQIGHWHR